MRALHLRYAEHFRAVNELLHSIHYHANQQKQLERVLLADHVPIGKTIRSHCTAYTFFDGCFSQVLQTLHIYIENPYWNDTDTSTARGPEYFSQPIIPFEASSQYAVFQPQQPMMSSSYGEYQPPMGPPPSYVYLAPPQPMQTRIPTPYYATAPLRYTPSLVSPAKETSTPMPSSDSSTRIPNAHDNQRSQSSSAFSYRRPQDINPSTNATAADASKRTISGGGRSSQGPNVLSLVQGAAISRVPVPRQQSGDARQHVGAGSETNVTAGYAPYPMHHEQQWQHNRGSGKRFAGRHDRR
jgi:hypothetical protein